MVCFLLFKGLTVALQPKVPDPKQKEALPRVVLVSGLARAVGIYVEPVRKVTSEGRLDLRRAPSQAPELLRNWALPEHM